MKKTKTSDSPTCAQNLISYFAQYCSSSSIHGVQYLGERGRYIIEKFIWAVIITTLWYFCIVLIIAAYHKWVNSPVIVSFATTEKSISEIPFPAITICPEVKSDPARFNFTDVFIRKFLNLTSEKEDKDFESMSLVCNGPLIRVTNDTLHLKEVVDENTVINLLHMTPGFTSSGTYDNDKAEIIWLNQNRSWPEFTSTLFTSQGHCYTFNMIDLNEIFVKPEHYMSNFGLQSNKSRNWSYDGGYSNTKHEGDFFPRRTFLSGREGGATFTFYVNHSHLDYVCGISLQGFQVVLHHPFELPRMDQHFRLPLDQAVNIGIKPRLIVVGDELKSYKPEDRKCYFSNERDLVYFNNYTQNNCLEECLANYTLSYCNCVPFYMPRHHNAPICGFSAHSCLEMSKVKFLSIKESAQAKDCRCLPSCNSLEYDIEISQSNWDWRKVFEVSKLAGGDVPAFFQKDHFSVLAVYFKEMEFLPTVRHELQGYVDFFSNTGGLLGLFIGFSVTSIIEILYFLTLRLACNIHKYGRRFWSGDPQLINADTNE